MKLDKSIFAVCVLLLSTNVISDTSQQHLIQVPTFYPAPFDSELATAVAAAERYNPDSIKEDREYIGGVFKHRQTSLYYYSVIPGKPGKNQITATLQFPDSLELIAIWHTHGNGKGTYLFFSQQDVILATRLGIPIYLADSSGFLKKFTPGDLMMSRYQARRQGLGYKKGYAKGIKMKKQSGQFIKIPTFHHQ
ncbi:DUF4329 domain-containing protein [Endozoicomonas elysicola]|uniref:DUF4329 domain-containing protein n=1 Tax=Endozoicomonas elysicola TaxID=305900 RepID=A0A081KBB9_9GAMM|nr:DUF4329 domain-containing protein [Endozoicomonas elysicola]KEI71445.1 hypothetical protein GV64_12455 [Endozoicomonas elysicola]